MNFEKLLQEELSRQQQNYFKDSKIRDDEGNLIVCYHGTPNPGFDEFNPKNSKSQFGNYKFGSYNVNYFTKDKDSARSYTNIGIDEGNNLYACYLNIINPYIVDNKTEAEMKTSFNIKDNRLRQKEIQLFDRIFNKWKNKILDYSDFRFPELNRDLNKLNLELRPSDTYDSDTDPEDIDYFDLYTLGNNSFFGAEHPIFYQYSTDEIFSDDMYEDLKETVIGEPDDYYFSTDDIVRYVISLNEEDGEDYDGIIIPDIIDSKEMFSAITTDYITLKSPNQIKLVNNVNPTSSNKINEDVFDDDRNILYTSPNYTKEVKPNCTRLYHQTMKQNINSILDNGLLCNKARFYDNPGNVVWFSSNSPLEKKYSDWNYGDCLIEVDIPNDFIDGSDFRKVNDREYNSWKDIPKEYINAIYLRTPYITKIRRDFNNVTHNIEKSLERFKNGELTERANNYSQLQKVNNRYPDERYWFAKTFKNEKSKEPETHKIALQLQTDDISIVDEVLKEIIPFDYDRIRIFGSTNNLDTLKNDGYELLSLTEDLDESLLNENKSWDVIWTNDCESFKNKLQAIKRAKEIYEKDLDKEVFIIHADDEDSDGYYANSEIIYIKDLYESLNEGFKIISDEDNKLDNKVKKENVIVDIYYDRHERMYAVCLKDKTTGNTLSNYEYVFTKKEAEITKQDMLSNLNDYIDDIWELEEKFSKKKSNPPQLINNFLNYLKQDLNPTDYVTDKEAICFKSAVNNLIKAYNDNNIKDVKLCLGILNPKDDSHSIEDYKNMDTLFDLNHIWVELDGKVYATNEDLVGRKDERIPVFTLNIDKNKPLISQVEEWLNIEESLKESISNSVKPYTCGYIKEDGSIIYCQEYHGEDKNLTSLGYPEFSETHPEEDTCIRLFNEPNDKQYEVLENIIDDYLDREDYCKLEIWNNPEKNKNYTFYKIYSIYEGACDDSSSFEELVGNWTGYDLIRVIKNNFR